MWNIISIGERGSRYDDRRNDENQRWYENYQRDQWKQAYDNRRRSKAGGLFGNLIQSEIGYVGLFGSSSPQKKRATPRIYFNNEKRGGSKSFEISEKDRVAMREMMQKIEKKYQKKLKKKQMNRQKKLERKQREGSLWTRFTRYCNNVFHGGASSEDDNNKNKNETKTIESLS